MKKSNIYLASGLFVIVFLFGIAFTSTNSTNINSSKKNITSNTNSSPLSQAVTFNQAVDNPDLSFTFGGDANWFVVTNTSYYGGSSVESGNIGNSQSSYFETTVQGPGTILFYWAVSSESGWDYLEFDLDGSQQNEMCGNVRFQQQEYSVTGSGTHTLEWDYSKDGSESLGDDCGWVDYIQWVPQNSYNIILNSITPNPSTTGSVSLSWNSIPSATSYNIYRSTIPISSIQGLTPIAIVTSTSYNGFDPIAGTYYYAVTAVNSTTESPMSNCRPVLVSSISNALDNNGLLFNTGGNAQWYPETNTSYYGGSAVASGYTTTGQSTWLGTTIKGNGTIQFYWYVSAQCTQNYLSFSIDGVQQSTLYGINSGWQKEQFTVTGSGTHDLNWTYSDVSYNYDYNNIQGGLDCGWVDDVQWISQSPSNTTLNAITPNPSSTGNVTLNWNTITNANYFNIYRSANIINTTQGLTPIGSIANTTYTDIGLHNGTYYYVVTYVNNTSESKVSNCESVVVSLNGTGINPITAPFPPLNLQVIGGIQNETISWNVPSYNGGSPILGYNIYSGTTLGREALLTTLLNVSNTTYVDTGLKNGTIYYYRVCAYNSIGVGPLSNENSSMTTGFPPTAPRDLRIYVGNGQAILSWTPPLFINSPSITEYKIYRGTSSGNESYLTTVHTTTYTNTNLTNGQTCYYKIKAVNFIGESPYSKENRVTPRADLSFTLQVNLSHGHIVLTWNTPPIYNGLDQIIYRIYRGNSSGQETYLVSVSNVLNYTDSNIQSGQNYYYEVFAYNNLGQGILSNQGHTKIIILSTGDIVAIATASAASACLIIVGVVMYMKKKKPIRTAKGI